MPVLTKMPVIENTSSESTVTSIEAGIDWISASIHSSHFDYHKESERIELLCLSLVEDGYNIVPASMNGYTGFKVGKFFCGRRSDGFFTQISGSAADTLFPVIYTPIMKTTRLDVQMTVKYSEPRAKDARRTYARLLRNNRNADAGKRRKCQLIQASDGFGTVYSGSRTSRQFGRLYDKFAESRQQAYENSWRYECVFKSDISTEYAGRAFRNAGKLAEWSATLVNEWWRQRNVAIYGIGVLGVCDVVRPRSSRNDVESSLLWLQRQVAPTIARLTRLGYRDSVLAALGID